MKLSIFFLLPAALAFAPLRNPARPSILHNQVTDVTDKVVSKTEEVVGKVDDIFLKRAMRFVDHAPMLVTLKALASKAGSAKWGIDMAPAACINSPLAIPGWTANIWSLVAITQLASVAKSALADNSNDLSQADITGAAVTNHMAMRSIASANPFRDTLALAVVSGYAARRGAASGEANIHNVSTQLISAFATVQAVLGSVTVIASRIGVLDGRTEVVKTLAVGAYWMMVNRSGNSTVKKAVNAGVIGGMLWARMAASGISFTTNSLLSASLIGTIYVAYAAFDKLKNAVM